MSTDTPVLALKGVSKRFGAVQALDNVDFEVPRGDSQPRTFCPDAFSRSCVQRVMFFCSSSSESSAGTTSMA